MDGQYSEQNNQAPGPPTAKRSGIGDGADSYNNKRGEITKIGSTKTITDITFLMPLSTLLEKVGPPPVEAGRVVNSALDCLLAWDVCNPGLVIAHRLEVKFRASSVQTNLDSLSDNIFAKKADVNLKLTFIRY